MQIPIKCKGNRNLSYKELKTFQGNLKEMSKSNAEKLKKSILKYGWIAPIFVWNKDYILDGHGRLLILGELFKIGYQIDNLPIVDIEAKTKKEAAEILLAINSKYQNITEEGLYQFVNEMELDLTDIKDFELPDIDMERFEMGYFENKGLDDEIPEVPEEPSTKIGDLYILGSHRLLCGDATKKEDVERLMDGKKADMVFTDPPYGVAYSSKNKFLNNIDKGNRIQADIQNDMLSEKETQNFWYKYFLLTKDYLNKVHSYYIFSPQIQGMMMMMMMKAGMPYRHVLIWVKNNHVLGRTDYNYKHEPILFGWLEKGTHKFYGQGQQKFSVWEYDKPIKSDLHPTMKPIALIENALLNSSKKNEICIDSFLGSGSTLIACEKTNRICYGMEIDPHYCDVIVERYCKYIGKNTIIKNGKEIQWKI